MFQSRIEQHRAQNISLLHSTCDVENAIAAVNNSGLSQCTAGATLEGTCLELLVLAMLETKNHVLCGRKLSVDQGLQTRCQTPRPNICHKRFLKPPSPSIPRPRRKPSWSAGCSCSKKGAKRFNNNSKNLVGNFQYCYWSPITWVRGIPRFWQHCAAVPNCVE